MGTPLRKRKVKVKLLNKQRCVPPRLTACQKEDKNAALSQLDKYGLAQKIHRVEFNGTLDSHTNSVTASPVTQWTQCYSTQRWAEEKISIFHSFIQSANIYQLPLHKPLQVLKLQSRISQ